MYFYKIFDSFTNECEKIWRETETNSNSNFFQNFDYIHEVANKSNADVKIIILFHKKKVIAILPLEIKKYFIFNVLQWIGTNYSDYCNPLFSKNFENNLNKDY